MKNIVLVGFMGTGKTSVARSLAGKLGREFLELDSVIEKREGVSIKEIFETKGESYFRGLEKEAVKEASRKEGVVISAGGGAIIDEENFNNLKKNGVIVCLEASPDTILGRTRGSERRPLLNVSDPRERIEKLLSARAPYYKKADHRVSTDELTIDQVVDKIIALITTT